jgi:hypothetical protein
VEIEEFEPDADAPNEMPLLRPVRVDHRRPAQGSGGDRLRVQLLGQHEEGPVTDLTEYLDALAIFLDLEPAAAAKLLAEHVDDGRGYCRVCTLGAQHGNHHWPCDIYNTVTLALTTRT